MPRRFPPPADLYDYDDAAALTGYTPGTVREYTRTLLTRGRHWIILERQVRYGAWRRRRARLTLAGIAALIRRRARSLALPSHDAPQT